MSTRPIVILGPNGQVGWELRRSLAPLAPIVPLDREAGGDLAHTAQLLSTLQGLQPRAVVNAAAYTAVDKAETDVDAARLINATAVGGLARFCADAGIPLVHYSTDYVFDGSGDQPWREDAPIAPLSVYGQTKAEGEALIRDSGAHHLILRTSWVYARRGGNFARTMLRLAQERDSLRVIADQIGAPTGAELIADVTAHALKAMLARHQPHAGGTYHLAAAGACSWHAYATLVLDTARQHGLALRVAADSIAAITSSEYPVPARRPLNSRLDTMALRRDFGLALPPWQDGVRRVLHEWLAAA